MTEIREMKKEDCQDVWNLQKQCFSVPWSLESLEDMFRVEGYTSLVASDGCEIIGYIGMKAVFDEADITNVAVSPVMRKKGIGKQLIQQLLIRADQKQINRIFLEVRVSNEAAICLYQNAGFKEIDRRKGYYEKPREDAFIMVWENTNSY
ncbi:MAG: ribosomal protein S18-alanine N-acetyltransferase [Lachnospiraceae bacterium]|nr:ribosomal protein S18-alanine N-acetyltransferase [Lachnospiraceae bacterium]